MKQFSFLRLLILCSATLASFSVFCMEGPVDEDVGVPVLPSIEERNRLFARSELQAYVSSMDEYSRDALYSQAKELPLEKLALNYAKIPKEKLAKLKQVVISPN